MAAPFASARSTTTRPRRSTASWRPWPRCDLPESGLRGGLLDPLAIGLDAARRRPDAHQPAARFDRTVASGGARVRRGHHLARAGRHGLTSDRELDPA